MSEKTELKTPNSDELREIIEKQPEISIAEKGELIKRLDEENDPAKLYGELVKDASARVWCCWWVCDGAAGGQCNCNCEMVQHPCGCGDMKVPGICQAGQQG